MACQWRLGGALLLRLGLAPADGITQDRAEHQEGGIGDQGNAEGEIQQGESPKA